MIPGSHLNPIQENESALHLTTFGARFSRILVATDFSPPATQALNLAIAISKVFDSSIHVVHAALPYVYAAATYPMSADCFNINVDRGRAEMAQLIAKCPDLAGITFKATVTRGEPVEQVEQIVAEEKIDLIVVGSHGYSGLEKVALGSIAETILRRSPCPVLIAGPHCRPELHPFRSVLLATDLKTTGLRAAQYASALAEKVSGQLTLLHVIEKGFHPDVEQRETEESRVLRELASLIPADAQLFCTTQLRVEYGLPVQIVPAIAKSVAASLVVVGLQDESALATRVPWSTLSHMVRDLKCGVLGVRKHLV
jgi:nucleotide-binding universal stress UspA family protein